MSRSQAGTGLEAVVVDLAEARQRAFVSKAEIIGRIYEQLDDICRWVERAISAYERSLQSNTPTSVASTSDKLSDKLVLKIAAFVRTQDDQSRKDKEALTQVRRKIYDGFCTAHDTFLKYNRVLNNAELGVAYHPWLHPWKAYCAKKARTSAQETSKSVDGKKLAILHDIVQRAHSLGYDGIADGVTGWLANKRAQIHTQGYAGSHEYAILLRVISQYQKMFRDYIHD